MIFKLTLLEFKKTKYIFVLPLILLFFLYGTYVTYLSDHFERIFYSSGTQVIDLNFYTTSLFSMLFYVVSVGILTYVQFYFESPVYTNPLPVTKQQLFLPKLLVALALAGSFLLVDIGVYTFILVKNFFWIREGYALLPFGNTAIRIQIWSYVLNAFFRFLDMLIAYCAVGFLFGVMGNRICALIFGLMFPYVPFGCMALFSLYFPYNIYLAVRRFLPWLAVPIFKENDRYQQFFILLPNKEVVGHSAIPIASFQWDFLGIAFEFIGKGMILLLLCFLFYHFYNHMQKIQNKQWILFPFAEKIFVFSFAIFFADFMHLLWRIAFFRFQPTDLLTLLFIGLGGLIGGVLVLLLNHRLPARFSKKGRV